MKTFLHYTKERYRERGKRENCHPVLKNDAKCFLKRNHELIQIAASKVMNIS
jgi:hypothetical protein